MESDSLRVADIAAQFGVSVEELIAVYPGITIILNDGLEYTRLEDQEAQKIIQEIEAGVRQSGGAKPVLTVEQAYDQDWSRRRALLEATGNLAYTSLRDTEIMRDPGGIRVLRLNGQYVLADVRFESRWFAIFREWVARSYLQGFHTIVEFGAGGGENLAAISSLFPDKHFVGLDRSPASGSMVSLLGKLLQRDIVGGCCDMKEPTAAPVLLDGHTAVLTVNALEQVGKDWKPFVDYLLSSTPGVVVNIEPIIEWYDPDSPFDAAAISQHRASGYLEGYAQRIQELHERGEVAILKAKRTHMGTRGQDSYGLLVWRCGPDA